MLFVRTSAQQFLTYLTIPMPILRAGSYHRMVVHRDCGCAEGLSTINIASPRTNVGTVSGHTSKAIFIYLAAL